MATSLRTSTTRCDLDTIGGGSNALIFSHGGKAMTGEELILRVQDKDGRGPWKPGFSHTWIDLDRPEERMPPSIFTEVEDLGAEIARWHRRGYHIGCAVEGMTGLRKWFSLRELTTLRSMGYHVYDFTKTEKVISTPTQVVIASRVAFRKFPKVTFDIDAAYDPGGSIWNDQ
jgi:hypothetical protein